MAGVPYPLGGGASGRWAVVRSVSKWLGPDLRCAVLAGDDSRLRASKVGSRSDPAGSAASSELGSPPACGRTTDVAAVVHQAADVYTARRTRLVDALAAHGLAAHGRSGLNVWVPVPDEDAAIRALLAHGVSVAAARRSASRPGRRSA